LKRNEGGRRKEGKGEEKKREDGGWKSADLILKGSEFCRRTVLDDGFFCYNLLEGPKRGSREGMMVRMRERVLRKGRAKSRRVEQDLSSRCRSLARFLSLSPPPTQRLHRRRIPSITHAKKGAEQVLRSPHRTRGKTCKMLRSASLRRAASSCF